MSLRLRLLLFAIALVTLPGLIFAVVAFSGTRDALQREVGIQLQQTSERAADTLAGAIAKGRADARSWTIQDVMRDLVVGDLDKRVSRFLQTVTLSNPAYLDAVCVDERGTIIAASSGRWMTQKVSAEDASGDGLRGPLVEPVLGRSVLEIAAVIPDPDAAGRSLGRLVLFYDWGATGALLDEVRSSLSEVGKTVAALIVDTNGRVIGGISFDGESAVDSLLARESWHEALGERYGSRRVQLREGGEVQVLVGTASARSASERWRVVSIERASEALAPIRRIGTTWIAALGLILLVGLQSRRCWRGSSCGRSRK